MNAIALGTLLVSSLLHAAPGDEDLGDVGESCRSRADCRSGLKCAANVCAQDSKEGQACGATRECGGGGLRCLDHVCRLPQGAPAQVQPQPSAAPYVPPPPPAWSAPQPVAYAAPTPAPYAAPQQYPAQQPYTPAPQYAAQPSGFSGPPSAAFNQPSTVSESVKHDESTLEGSHGYFGGTAGVGPISVNIGGAIGSGAGVPLAFQGGVWFGRFDLRFELSPFTDLAIDESGAVPMFSLMAKPGFLAVMHERGDFAVGWAFRLGVGVGVMFSVPVARFQAQLIGIGIRTGKVHLEFGLPFDAALGGPVAAVRVPLTCSMTWLF